MLPKDNRGFINALEKTGDLVRVKQEVDWDLEVGAITRRVCETGSPAPLFENIKGYPPGFRILGTPLANQRRLATALGLKPDVSFREILETFGERIEKPIKPVVVKTGPCKENVISEDKVDLFSLPIPMIHEGDGGRYLSWQMLVTKDPDSDWINWGMYRQMVHNRRYLGGLVGPFSHAGMVFYPKYVGNKKHMPFAISVTPDPLSALVSMLRFDPYVSEVDYAGGLMQQPVELVKCETNDIMVPAHAEIIIEGELLYDQRVLEGPFGEFTGYRSTPRDARSVFRVKTVTHRNDPILGVSNMGVPVDDSHVGTSIGVSWNMTKILKTHGIPITDAYAPPQGLGNELAIVGVKTRVLKAGNISSHIGNLLSSIAWQPGMLTKLIVVDEDVNVFNLDEVLHAFVTKCHPSRGIRIRDNEMGVVIAPYLSYEERLWGKGARVIFDCTWPLEWPVETAIPPKVSFEDNYPSELKKHVMKNWKSYGFK